MTDRYVTVLVSTELLAVLREWSQPVQVQIIETPGSGTGYEMNFRTDTTAMAAIRRALEAMPAQCRYHGDNLTPDHRATHYDKSCCDTGKPSLYRRDAEAALNRIETGTS